MRGYRILRKKGRLRDIKKLKASLADIEFEEIRHKTSKIVFGASADDSSIVVRQYLYRRLLIGLGFNKSVLLSIGTGKPIIYPMPKEWQNSLISMGYEVDRIACQLLWCAYLVFFFSYGLFQGIKVIGTYFSTKLFSKKRINQPFAYFCNLQKSNISTRKASGDYYNIIEWYKQWGGRNHSVRKYIHSVKNVEGEFLENSDAVYEPLISFRKNEIKCLLLFLVWYVTAISICIRDMLLLRWWTPLVMEQCVLAAALRITEDSSIAKEYLLHNSSWVYRPIWTYEAERCGSRILFYFYSTNCEEFKTKEGYPENLNGWNLATWPNVLVWNQYQGDFVKRTFHSADKIINVGPIWFSSSSEVFSVDSELIGLTKAAIFDVQPHRASRFQLLGASTVYFSSKVAIQFLMDIYKVLDENNIVVLHKAKRSIGNILHPRYRNILKEFSSRNHISINPNFSASYIIDQADMVISMPFTSTALVGENKNRPSIYYDPFGGVERDDRAAHNIPIVTGIDELRIWIRKTKQLLTNNSDIDSGKVLGT